MRASPLAWLGAALLAPVWLAACTESTTAVAQPGPAVPVAATPADGTDGTAAGNATGSQDPAPQDLAGLDVAALRERAAGAERKGEFAIAADVYLELARREPQRAQWVVAAGRCLGRSGRLNDALDLLTEKKPQFAGVLDLTAMLARTHLLKAEQRYTLNPELSLTDAASLAQEVLAADPDHEDALLILAQARYALGDLEAAIASAEEAVRRHPQRAGSHILIGRIAFDRFRLLKRQLQEAEAAGAPPEAGQHAVAVAAIDAERKRARAAFERAAELDTERSFALVSLGDLAAWDQDFDLALGHWLDALAREPSARIDHELIAQRFPAQQRVDGYRRALERYRARPGSTPDQAATIEWHVARALFDLGDFAAARDAFGAVFAANPEYTNAQYWLFLCAWRSEDHAAATRHAAAYSAVSAPAFADVLRGIAPELRGELTSAIRWLADRAYREGAIGDSRDLNHTIACLIDSADAWNNYAFLCRETERFDDAWNGYQHALEKEPDSPQLWNDAAVILQYHQPSPENLAKAREMYERALLLAERAIADPKTGPALRERAQQAKADARLNLQALDAK